MNLGPIPAHLARFAWYAPHQAWLRDEGLPHHDPGDAQPKRAILTGADLTGADLTDANLTGADLTGADGLPVTHKQAVANLDAIREIVLASPERCFMSLWHGDLSWESRTSEEEISCGTTHCLAGWAQVLTRCGGKPWCEGILQIWPAAHMTTASNEEALEYLRNREYAKGA